MNEELESLLREADTAIESCQRLQAARNRIVEIDHYIPEFRGRIAKLLEIDPEGGVLAKLRNKLSALETERAELQALVNPGMNEKKVVAVAAKTASFTDALKEVESSREDRKQEHAARNENTKKILESVAKFRIALIAHENNVNGTTSGEGIDCHHLRELVEQVLYLTHGGVLEFKEFIALVKPYAECFAQGKAFKVLRKKLREDGVNFDSFKVDSSEEPDVAGTSEDTLYEKLEGKTVAILGGDRIGNQLDKYKDHFRFKEIVWSNALKSAEVNSMVESVLAGSIDVVFCIIDFCGHGPEARLRDACKKMGLPFIRVHGGYGLANFAQSFMRQQGVSV